MKMVVFLIAMFALVSGLRGLHTRRLDAPAYPGAEVELQHLREENARLRERLDQALERGEEGIHGRRS
jgi:hypothetical protein